MGRDNKEAHWGGGERALSSHMHTVDHVIYDKVANQETGILAW